MLHKYLFSGLIAASSQLTLAQPPTTIGSDDLNFYLFQAFQAATAAERLPLNHIGVQVEEFNGGFLVTAVLEGYPAHLAGINRGDIIESVNGEPYHPIYSFNNAESAASEFRANDKEFMLVVRRDESWTNLALRPVFENLFDSYRTATLNSIQEFSAGNKVIGYVRLWGLSRSSTDLISYQNIIRELDHCDGLIFDLRSSVGYLDLQHLDLVFPNRSRYFSITSASGPMRSLSDSTPLAITASYRKPIAILIDAQTKGGPELFAYQLDKLERVRTLGTGSAGHVGDFTLSTDDGLVELRYQPAGELRIDGASFEGIGVTPEIEVAYPYDQTTRADPQYEAAVNTLLGII